MARHLPRDLPFSRRAAVQHTAPRPQPDEPVEDLLRDLLVDVLGLTRSRVNGFGQNSGLFGALPEFDSMAVANLLTGLEERLGILIEDDDVEAEDFATFGQLLALTERLAG